MGYKEQLEALRKDIDVINGEMLNLLEERVAVSEKIALVKRDGNMGVYDEKRERQILDWAVSEVDDKLKSDAVIFMSTLMAISKRSEHTLLMQAEPVMLPESRTSAVIDLPVGFQGVPGAWGEMGANALYPEKSLKNYDEFEDVFTAVTLGEISYGVLPIENSETGAIGEVYDLLRRHGCYIVGQTWVDARHCLMAKPETRLEDVREVLSHPQGFKQCHKFLKGRSWDKIACSNTAVAAEQVASRQDNRAAAIGSRRAAERNGLVILAPDIMDNALNKTRFIAISSQPEYDETCDAVSVTFSTAHVSGALCNVLHAFMSTGVNLSRIESRPASGGKYRFFADLQANILDPLTQAALAHASSMCEYFEVLGCYHA